MVASRIAEDKISFRGFIIFKPGDALCGWWEGCRDKLEEVWKLEVQKKW